MAGKVALTTGLAGREDAPRQILEHARAAGLPGRRGPMRSGRPGELRRPPQRAGDRDQTVRTSTPPFDRKSMQRIGRCPAPEVSGRIRVGCGKWTNAAPLLAQGLPVACVDHLTRLPRGGGRQ